MKIKEIWLNMMNTVTMKGFAALIVLDILSILCIIAMTIYCMGEPGGEVLIFLVMFSIPYFVLIKLFIPTVVYLFERKAIKQGIRPNQSKVCIIFESISVIIQLLILAPLIAFTLLFLISRL